MRTARALGCCFVAFAVAAHGAPLAPSPRTHEIDRLMQTLYSRGQFNGSIVVAKDGRVIYRHGFGEANARSHSKFTPDTISNIGSVSKQFTAMAVMMLAEQRKLAYDDPVSEYVPELTTALKGITLRQLLNHTSGIPDVGDLGIDHPKLTNEDVVRRLANPDYFTSRPGEKYRYSNANYVLLARVVERVSGEPFPQFLAENILRPLAMRNTFVGPPTRRVVAAAYDPFGNRAGSDDLLTGSSGMYSTVNDLLEWDRALYSERLVRNVTLEEAFKPGAVTVGQSTYGFGWNVDEKDGSKFVWHQGATGGYRAFIGRRLSDKLTVIMLTNKGNTKRQQISDAILDIIDGKRYTLPQRSIAQAMYDAIRTRGLQAAVNQYKSLRKNNDTTYDFSESELNALGYQILYGNRRPADAIEIFKLNAVAYSRSSNVFDSLGEAYEVSGSKALAIASYTKAIQLDRTNFHAVEMLKKLQ